MKPYLIPAETISFTEEIKKSQFITYLAHTDGIEAAKDYIQSIKAQYQMPGTIAGHLLLVGLMIHKN
ncbi:IMPACT family member yigZ [Providencia rettgeri]|uniref:IMPACT family member yigZ n=1 Tax=Providencia rettgeri TaxID=587 RepID=A0A379FM45_PRORE|nr:IMPACT family member yigZ [Providencia rettgeri]